MIRVTIALVLLAGLAGLPAAQARTVASWTNADRSDDGILEPGKGTIPGVTINASPSTFHSALAATKDGVREIKGNSVTFFVPATTDQRGQSIEDAVRANQYAEFSFQVSGLAPDAHLEVTGLSYQYRPNGNRPAHVFGAESSQAWIESELVGESAAHTSFALGTHTVSGLSRTYRNGDTFTGRIYFAGFDGESQSGRKFTDFHRGIRFGNVRVLGRVGGGGKKNEFQAGVLPILEANCFKCHGPEKQKGKVRLDTLSTDFVSDRAAAETWHDAMDVIQIGDMPPDDEPELTAGERTLLTAWIRRNIEAAVAAARGNADGVVLRRLNNTEYRHTLTDLLGVATDYGAKLPPDPLSPDGFRNEGATLGMSALQLEYYLESARNALATVLVEGEQPPRTSQRATETDPLNGYGAGNPANRLGRVHYYATQIDEPPRFGDFKIRVTARAELVEGQPAPLLQVDYGNKISGAISFIDHVGLAAVTSEEPRIYEFQGRAENFPLLPEQRGEPAQDRDPKSTYVQFVLLENALTDGEPDPKPLPKKKGEKKKGKQYTEDPDFPKIIVDSVEFIGHDYVSWPPEAHRSILYESENEGTSEYAANVLERFLRRAWRRPPSGAEVATYLAHYESILADGVTPIDAWRETLAVAISSPNFLFLAEPRPENEIARPLTDHELAARLSYFLWSSMPDDELSQFADSGKLRDPKILAAQTARLLADEKSDRFVNAFSSQWLDLDGVDRIAVNPEFYPNFDDALKPDMIRETQAFFGEVLRTGTSALQFLDADFTMANAALARHYGIEGPQTHEFERVSLEGSDRPGGLLGHASIYLANSDGGDSHPIKRAVWIRERLLHDPPLPPPPNVPSLDKIDPDFAKLSISEQMEIHRSDPACNDCHRGIDPWGIALERFDALGLERDEVRRPSGKGNKFDTLPVVTETILPGGHEIDGLDDLKNFLLGQRRNQFAHAFVSKLLTYALGRPLELTDQPTIEELSHGFAENDYQIPHLLERIALSEPFLTK